MHDSLDAFFLKDRLRPTEMLEEPFHVSFYERLYAPIDAAGNPLPTINQKFHRSVVARYGKPASLLDPDGTCSETLYLPRNLSPFFTAGGSLKVGFPIAG